MNKVDWTKRIRIGFGEILVCCKHGSTMRSPSNCSKNNNFNCGIISCISPSSVSWIFYLVNSKHLIEVKNE